MNLRIYKSIKIGNADNNIRFTDLQNLIIALGFKFKSQKGSHIIYYHESIKERINVQRDGSKAKAYQVEQLREIILKHNL